MTRTWMGRRLTAAAALVAGSLLMPGPVAGAGPTCARPVPSTTQPSYRVADPHCDFDGAHYGAAFVPLTDANGNAISSVYAGIAAGASYRIEVPKQWNHELVLFAHGFRGLGHIVWVDNPDLRDYYVSLGFAWAASSYETNGYDVGHGVTDTHELIGLFHNVVGSTPTAMYMSGLSMGGHITAAEIEHYRNTFVGAMPYCGVLADTSLFDFFLDANVTAAGLTGTSIQFPKTLAAARAYTPLYDQQVLSELPKLGRGFNTGSLSLTELGKDWGASVEQRSGGTRPGFNSAFGYWNAFRFPPLTNIPSLLGLYPGLSAGTIGIAKGNVTDNLHTTYQTDGDPAILPEEQRLNAHALRVSPTAGATTDLTGIPAVFGDPRIPVLSLHGVGDLFVPFSMDQIYARRAASYGESNMFVSRAIRENAHCGYTQAELQRGFSDLVRWVRTGHRAAGDDILNPTVVAQPGFGCVFTDGPHPEFSPPCPGKTSGA